MAPIEYLFGAISIPALWAALHLVLGIKKAKLFADAIDWPRPKQLAVVLCGWIAVVVAFDWLIGSPMQDRLGYVLGNYDKPELSRTQVQLWSSFTYSLTFVLGLPVAFLLWHWRDRNVRDQIENARKDTNLKEFQEVQQRAAGALDDKLPEEAREQLQIAALHQLRGFLRGDYGKSFQRPAFELLLAGHAAAVHRIGVPAVQAQLKGKSREQIKKAIKSLRAKLTPIDHTRMEIIRDEVDAIFGSGFPLDGRRFELLDLSKSRFPKNVSLIASDFFGAELWRVSLKAANLFGAWLIGSNCTESHLEGADLGFAHLKGMSLCGAFLEGANLSNAYLEGADLSWAHLEGADLRAASLDDATECGRARFNAETQFGDDWSQWAKLSEAEKEELRAPWIARGMINVDAPASVPPDGASGA